MPVSKLTSKKRAAALKIKAAKAAALEAELLAALGIETAVEPDPEPVVVQLPRTVWERFKDLW